MSAPLRERLAGCAYTTLLRTLQPLYALRLWRRGRAEPLYRHAIGERFGRYGRATGSGWLWVHAVSLGETRAAAALVDALRAERPEARVLLTHGTATGREAGAALLRPGDMQAWLPYDTPGAVARFYRRFRPQVGVLMETEIWPNLLRGAARAGVPVVLANARLNARSHRRGDRLADLRRPAMARLALAIAQTDDDALRLREAGAHPVVVGGNLKFDMTPDAGQLETGHAWRTALGRPVVLAASTREGEEAELLAAWVRTAADGAAAHATGSARPLLLIVPRHPQRFDEVAALAAAAGLSVARRSAWAAAPDGAAALADVWIGDSMGEMALYYALADVALLGGSFAPLGGQNLIEAASCGCPVVMGPHTFNFAEAAEQSVAHGAALRVDGIETAVLQSWRLVGSAQRMTMAAEALSFAAAHRGAAVRMAAWIAGHLPPRREAAGPALRVPAGG